jgi:hypothetical protein
VAATYEYWTAVFRVGLEGFNDYDHDEINTIAEEGWEPVNLTAVHNGFATLVLFRREVPGASRRQPAPVRKAAANKKATPAKAGAAKGGAAKGSAAKKAVASKAVASKAVASKKASPVAKTAARKAR